MSQLVCRYRIERRVALLFAFMVCGLAGVFAQLGAPVDVTGVAAAPAWKTEVIQLQPHLGLRLQQALEDPESTRAWDHFLHFPSIDASEKEIIAHIQKQTAAAKRLLSEAGLALPAGTALLWDADTGTLAVRSTQEALEWLNVLGGESRNRVEKNVNSTLRVVQADGSVMREIARETTTKLDHTPAWKRLEKLIAEDKAVSIQTLKLQTRNGMRSKVEIGSRDDRIESVVLEEGGIVKVNQGEGLVGTSLETDQVLFAGDDHVDVNLSMRHCFAESVTHEVPVGRVLSRDIVLPTTDDHYAQISTSFSVLDGSQTLLGVWKLTAPEDLARQDILQAAFLETRVVRNLPEIHPRALSLLSAHMDKAEPIPAKADRTAHLPAGMKTMRFRVPPDFLLSGEDFRSAESPPDPFAPEDSANDGKKRTIRTAMEVLKAQGIPFPEGTAAHFDQTTASLTVTNTQEALDLVEFYVSPTCGGGRPANIQFHIEILEADGALIRAMAEESSKIADHTLLLERLNEVIRTGQARNVGTLRTVTRSGQRMLAQSGALQIHGASVEPVTEKQETPKKGTGEEKSTSEIGANTKSGQKTAIEIKGEERFVGTRIELDGLIAPDGITLEMELALEHHYAPPTRGKEDAITNLGRSPSVTRVMKSSEVLHFASITSLFTMNSGTTRLFGMWKPEGASKYEGKDVMQVAFVRAAITREE
ncbi:hypothetical protein DES53_12319 [Roseimicrobium gellanilyticum]|uniref:Uncharacterized protein n=1 Tax=Roseimicrobium gellanilyticum TaxID=748857 RepID=A0A366H240_9BACT|nr:hypothetical protein [Roseimicrobium gellanilyticum]RBP35323.1 hypothetical protein DES53_12319 [Roseimicrobium gellanilyticum]